GHGILVLDWEADAISRGPAAAKNWLDRVYAKTGIRPWIYMSGSVTTEYDWSAVAKDYGLWVARYGSSSYGSTGKFGHPAAWQYTSSGRVSGYSGNVDLDEFYGDRDAWTAYATGDSSSHPDTDHDDTTDTGDDMPSYKHVSTSENATFPADGNWHRLRLSEDGVSLLRGPALVEGVLSVAVQTPDGSAREVQVRAVQEDALPDVTDKTVHATAAMEVNTSGGTTQIVLPFTQNVGKPDTKGATYRALRFQILMYGGGKATIGSVAANALYWEK
ncbi:GH25 family lysozyme, partial [Isoptericola hypogeus]|uniref:GH25 family lysozyme n=1 Tax=Isoptericola hypogeus TaxID=300179 RepID=UPI0031DA9E53